jgi:uncharacterized tellurite resistance protein B-like protein
VLAAIRSFFAERLQAPEGQSGIGAGALPLACAALMFEVIRADASIDAAERVRLRALLRAEFDLDGDDLDALEALAEQEVEDATDLYQFTRLVTEHCGVEERIAVIDRLWQVAWADGVIDPLEEHTIRRVADLIHVRHGDFVAARQRARDAFGGAR